MTANRIEYLKGLSEDYGVPMTIVMTLADMLGESEDYDGLVSSLEDYDMFNDEFEEFYF